MLLVLFLFKEIKVIVASYVAMPNWVRILSLSTMFALLFDTTNWYNLHILVLHFAFEMFHNNEKIIHNLVTAL